MSTLVGYYVKCKKCGRAMLVELGLFGVDHTAAVIASCWDCLDDTQKAQAFDRCGVDPSNTKEY